MRVADAHPRAWITVVALVVLGVISAAFGLNGDPCRDEPRDWGVFAAAVLLGGAAFRAVAAVTRWWIAVTVGVAVALSSGAALVLVAFYDWVSACTN